MKYLLVTAVLVGVVSTSLASITDLLGPNPIKEPHLIKAEVVRRIEKNILGEDKVATRIYMTFKGDVLGTAVYDDIGSFEHMDEVHPYRDSIVAFTRNGESTIVINLKTHEPD